MSPHVPTEASQAALPLAAPQSRGRDDDTRLRAADRGRAVAGVREMAHAESAYPGWLARLLTHPVRGLDRVDELFEKLNGGAKDAINVYCEVPP